MTPAQLAAVSYLARYSGHTHALYAYQLRRWFGWCETNALDPLVGIQRAHVELYIRHLGESGLMASSVNTMMHARPRVLPVRPHRRPDRRRPGRLRPAAEGPRRRVPHPGPGPARADPVPPGRPDPHRPPRRPGLPARHQRPARLRGRRGADRGLRRDPARPPGPAPGRQGQQARHHAADRPGAPRPGGLPRPAHRRAAGPAAASPASRSTAATPTGWSRHADPRTTEHYDRARGIWTATASTS